MPDYKSMYYTLAAGIANAIEALEKAQLKAEEEYISHPADEISVFNALPCKAELPVEYIPPAKCQCLRRNARAE